MVGECKYSGTGGPCLDWCYFRSVYHHLYLTNVMKEWLCFKKNKTDTALAIIGSLPQVPCHCSLCLHPGMPNAGGSAVALSASRHCMQQCHNASASPCRTASPCIHHSVWCQQMWHADVQQPLQLIMHSCHAAEQHHQPCKHMFWVSTLMPDVAGLSALMALPHRSANCTNRELGLPS